MASLEAPALRSSDRYRLAITLADGDTFAFDVKRMPRHWKSWVMQQMPYLTTFTGCTFTRKAL